jgi:hypothetical protein
MVVLTAIIGLSAAPASAHSSNYCGHNTSYEYPGGLPTMVSFGSQVTKYPNYHYHYYFHLSYFASEGWVYTHGYPTLKLC